MLYPAARGFRIIRFPPQSWSLILLGDTHIISTFPSLSFSSFKTGHWAGIILEVLSHADICGSERAPGNPCRTSEWSTSQRGLEGGWGLRGYCPGRCRVAASVPKCGFAGLCQARGSSALYNKPADTSQSSEFFSPSTDAFTPTQAPTRKRAKKSPELSCCRLPPWLGCGWGEGRGG